MKEQFQIEHDFYAAQSSVSNLMRLAENVCLSGGTIYGAIFSLQVGLEKIIPRLKRIRSIKISNSHPYLINKPSNKEQVGYSGFSQIYIWENDSLLYMLSCQAKEEFTEIKDIVHRYLLPDMCKVYLRTKEIRKALVNLSQSDSSMAIRVREITYRSFIDDPGRSLCYN